MGTIGIVSMVAAIILVLNVILASIMVFFERRKPSSTWAWLLVLFFIPVLGFVLYLIFGRDSKREKVFKAKSKYDKDVYYKYLFHDNHSAKKVQEQKKIVANGGRILDSDYLTDLAYLHINSGNWITFNNRVKKYTDGPSKFKALIDDIRSAKEYIHMEYYIIRGDELGKEIVHELALKAQQGVTVRLLYDGMGCRTLRKSFFRELHKAGGQTAAFLPPLILRLNYRNHRKLCVIDGKVGYIGGFNIGNEYMGLVKRYGAWRDTHIRIEGDAIDQLQIRFMMDWNFTNKKFQVPLTEYYFPRRMQFEGVKMQIVSSGPDTEWKNIRNGYFKMMNEAEDHIYVETPYFVPDDGILEALRVAALSGIDVRIIIPGNPDHFFVYWASMSYLGELLDAGVRCYQYEKGFIHAKAVFVDGSVASVGTANMDIRSFDLNFEVNAFIYDETTVKSMERDFVRDLDNCIEITKEWYRTRKWWFRLKESIARLISPML